MGDPVDDTMNAPIGVPLDVLLVDAEYLPHFEVAARLPAARLQQ